MSKYIPTAPEVVREGLIVLAGAVLAALVFQALPGLRAWVADRLPTAGK
jgi:hypothetical protein